LLTEGGHSTGFFDGGLIAFKHLEIAYQMCHDLAQLVKCMEDVENIDLLVGPEYGAVTPTVLLAVHLNKPYALVRPEGEGEHKS
jgi:orotate phosphoribosyltransferase